MVVCGSMGVGVAAVLVLGDCFYPIQAQNK